MTHLIAKAVWKQTTKDSDIYMSWFSDPLNQMSILETKLLTTWAPIKDIDEADKSIPTWW